jgi:hypothetical protein
LRIGELGGEVNGGGVYSRGGINVGARGKLHREHSAAEPQPKRLLRTIRRVSVIGVPRTPLTLTLSPPRGEGKGGASTFDASLPKRALFTEIFAAKQDFWMFVVQRRVHRE